MFGFSLFGEGPLGNTGADTTITVTPEPPATVTTTVVSGVGAFGVMSYGVEPFASYGDGSITVVDPGTETPPTPTSTLPITSNIATFGLMTFGLEPFGSSGDGSAPASGGGGTGGSGTGGGSSETPVGLVVESVGVFGYMSFGVEPFASGGTVDGSVTNPDVLPRLVAILNGPAGYIKEVDANGLTYIEIRYGGYISLPTIVLNGGPGDVLRYYRDPPNATGALLSELIDPTWGDMDLHRGNGYLDLGTFSIYDPIIGGGTGISGSLSATQGANTLAGTAIHGTAGATLNVAQAGNTLLSVGSIGALVPGGRLFAVQGDNYTVNMRGKVIVKGFVTATQERDTLLGSMSHVMTSGLLVADVEIGGYIEATPVIEAFYFADASIGPVIEGEVS